MTSIAAQHKTDWLHIYYANPSLPGFNPSHVKAGHVLRLGENPHASIAKHFLEFVKFLVKFLS